MKMIKCEDIKKFNTYIEKSSPKYFNSRVFEIRSSPLRHEREIFVCTLTKLEKALYWNFKMTYHTNHKCHTRHPSLFRDNKRITNSESRMNT